MSARLASAVTTVIDRRDVFDRQIKVTVERTHSDRFATKVVAKRDGDSVIMPLTFDETRALIDALQAQLVQAVIR